MLPRVVRSWQRSVRRVLMHNLGYVPVFRILLRALLIRDRASARSAFKAA